MSFPSEERNCIGTKGVKMRIGSWSCHTVTFVSLGNSLKFSLRIWDLCLVFLKWIWNIPSIRCALKIWSLEVEVKLTSNLDFSKIGIFILIWCETLCRSSVRVKRKRSVSLNLLWRKNCDATKTNYTVIEKEMLALVCDFDKFRSSLVGCKVVFYTYNTTIRNMYNQNDAKLQLNRWIMLLQEFYLEIKDRRGSQNEIADKLSMLESA